MWCLDKPVLAHKVGGGGPASNLRNRANQCKKWIRHPKKSHQLDRKRGINGRFHAFRALSAPEARSVPFVRPHMPPAGPLSGLSQRARPAAFVCRLLLPEGQHPMGTPSPWGTEPREPCGRGFALQPHPKPAVNWAHRPPATLPPGRDPMPIAKGQFSAVHPSRRSAPPWAAALVRAGG